MIITIRQLQAIHYYYFCMGIFSLSNAFFMGFDSLFSFIFLGFYAANSAVAWFVANVSRKRMKDYIVIQSRGFAIRHVAATVLTVIATTIIWSSNAIPDVGLLNALLMANYTVMFLAGMWYVITRTDLSRELFAVYDNHAFGRSKSFIIRVRQVHWKMFGRHLVTESDIRSYKYGSLKGVDENMTDAWRHRKKMQYVLECMARIELALARRSLGELKERISSLKLSPESRDNLRLIRESEQEYVQEERDIMEYEKEFYRKSVDPMIS
jgi:hypothetical protein